MGEVELAQGGEVEGEVLGRDALGVGEGVEDGEAHVGDGDLGEDAAVDEFDEGVDGGLGVDGDADLRGRQVEEAAGFDDLEALVHHGGGVDGDALAHDPGGVLEGLCGVMWSKSARGVLRKGPPEAVSQICLTSAGVPPRMALVDGVVLGVDGEEGYVVFAGGGDDELAGGYEALLVGEADGFAGADGGVGGFEAGYSDDGGDYEVDFGEGGDVDGAGGAVDDFDVGDACGFEAGGEVGGELLRWRGR